MYVSGLWTNLTLVLDWPEIVEGNPQLPKCVDSITLLRILLIQIIQGHVLAQAVTISTQTRSLGNRRRSPLRSIRVIVASDSLSAKNTVRLQVS